jgi:hypothetical protein
MGPQAPANRPGDLVVSPFDRKGGSEMPHIRRFLAFSRPRMLWIAASVAPLVVAACNNGGKSPGY